MRDTKIAGPIKAGVWTVSSSEAIPSLMLCFIAEPRPKGPHQQPARLSTGRVATIRQPPDVCRQSQRLFEQTCLKL
jgi:hypothetical protein